MPDFDIRDYKQLEYRRLQLELDSLLSFRRPDWKKAIQIQTFMCGLYPNHHNYCDRGELHMADSNWIAAIEDLETAIRYYPKRSTFEMLARCHEKLGQHDHAALTRNTAEITGV